MSVTVDRIIQIAHRHKLRASEEWLLLQLTQYVHNNVIVDPQTQLPMSTGQMSHHIGREISVLRRTLKRLVSAGLLTVANVGNSRVYRVREGLFDSE